MIRQILETGSYIPAGTGRACLGVAHRDAGRRREVKGRLVTMGRRASGDRFTVLLLVS